MSFLNFIRRSFFFFFFAVFLAGLANQARAGGPAFLVSVSNTTSHVSELLEVTTAPFGTNVITETNGVTVFTNAAPWSALAFSPAGTLYATMLGGGLASVNPADGSSSILGNLQTADGAAFPATGLAFATNGQAYVLAGSDELFAANLGSGLCTNVGTFSPLGLAGPPLVLATAPDGTMFGLFLGLYKINLSNAALTQIGSSFPFGNGANVVYAKAAAFGSDSNLYMVGWDSTATHHPELYQVNTTNGAVHALGSLPEEANGLVALGVGNAATPQIVVPPASQTAMAGSAVSFSVTVGDAAGTGAQWYFGNVDLGVTNFSLTLTPVSPTNAGNYFVVLTNQNGAATSAVVTLTVTAPILASTGSNIFLGGATNAILGLFTNPPMAAKLSGSNFFYSSLDFDAQGNLFAAGQYFALSTNAPLSTVTGVAGLFRINAQTGATNLVGNFQLNGNALPMPPGGMAFSPSGILYISYANGLYTVATNSGVMTLVGSFATAAPLQISRGLTSSPTALLPPPLLPIGGIAFASDGRLYGGDLGLYLINTNNAIVSEVAPLNGISASIQADMKYGADGFLYFFDGGADGNLYRLNPTNAQVSVAANYPFSLSGLAFAPTATIITEEPTNQIVPLGSPASFSVAATGMGTLSYQWYVNNKLIKGADTSVLNITNAQAANNGSYFVMVSNALGAVTSSTALLGTYTTPVITQAPKTPIVITPGKTISLSVKATGNNLKYQWQLNGTNLPGKTAASLVVSSATTNNAGTYTILVSSPYLAVPATATAEVSVLPVAPTIAAPANRATLSTNDLTVAGREPANGGASAILYQLNGGAIQSATVAANGLTWSAPVTLVTGTNLFQVWAMNASGVSATVQAEYSCQPFGALAGVYNGLFYDINHPAFTNAGYFTLTLASNGIFSGDLLLDGVMSSFSGAFAPNGEATVVAGTAPAPLLSVSMQMDFSGADSLSGTVSNNAASWSGSLTAYRAGFSTKAPATEYEGNFSLAINGSYDAAVAPPGYSYATATVSSAGNVSLLNGVMADGSTFTANGAISATGIWPMYSLLDGGKGAVLAWVKFPKRSAAVQTPANGALWTETAGANGTYYSNGFTLFTNQLSLLVNPYTVPAKGKAVLRTTNYTVELFGGNLTNTITNAIKISGSDVVTAQVNTNGLSILIAPANGTFSGSFINPVTLETNALHGILLPESNAGYGYFLGTNEAGGVIILP
jgi:Immunoglobulin I-set domain